MEIQRFILLAGLALVLLLLSQAWFEFEAGYEAATVTSAPGTTVSGLPPGEVPEAPPVEAAVSDTVPTAPGAPAAAAAPAVTEDTVTVTTDLLRVTISTVGGDIRRVALLDYPVSVDTPDDPFLLLRDGAGGDRYIAQSGLIGRGGDYPNHRTRYAAAAADYRLGDADDALEVPLVYTATDGVRHTKVFSFRRDSYRIGITHRIAAAAAPWEGFLYAQFRRTPPEDDGGLGFFGGLPSYTGGVIYTEEERYEKVDFADMQSADLARDVTGGWAAMLQHYFVGAWLPPPDGRHQLYSKVLTGGGANEYTLGYKTLTPLRLSAGGEGVLGTAVFIGPKEQARLRAQGAEGLLLTVDYGWLTPVASPLFWVLERIHRLSGNWGYAIILLTLLIKLLFFPLSAASYKSMARMKKFQPRLKTLRERYGDDKQKLNQEMMQLYKKEKINPLGGCLPILVQIPVFIALYWVLLESVELRQADFIWWLDDLSLPDPYYVLPLLMGGSMVAQQFLNPAPLDPMQKNIMMAMPVVFTVLFLWFPAGLVLYWVVNNILSIAQQWYITRKIVGE